MQQDSRFELRVEAELLDAYRRACQQRGQTPGTRLRKFMADYVEATPRVAGPTPPSRGQPPRATGR